VLLAQCLIYPTVNLRPITPLNPTSLLASKNARICSRLNPSAACMLTINPQHAGSRPLQLILYEKTNPRSRLILHETRLVGAQEANVWYDGDSTLGGAKAVRFGQGRRSRGHVDCRTMSENRGLECVKRKTKQNSPEGSKPLAQRLTPQVSSGKGDTWNKACPYLRLNPADITGGSWRQRLSYLYLLSPAAC